MTHGGIAWAIFWVYCIIDKKYLTIQDPGRQRWKRVKVLLVKNVRN